MPVTLPLLHMALGLIKSKIKLFLEYMGRQKIRAKHPK
jgi:hypothetical protein